MTAGKWHFQGHPVKMGIWTGVSSTVRYRLVHASMKLSLVSSLIHQDMLLLLRSR